MPNTKSRPVPIDERDRFPVSTFQRPDRFYQSAGVHAPEPSASQQRSLAQKRTKAYRKERAAAAFSERKRAEMEASRSLLSSQSGRRTAPAQARFMLRIAKHIEAGNIAAMRTHNMPAAVREIFDHLPRKIAEYVAKAFAVRWYAYAKKNECDLYTHEGTHTWPNDPNKPGYDEEAGSYRETFFSYVTSKGKPGRKIFPTYVPTLRALHFEINSYNELFGYNRTGVQGSGKTKLPVIERPHEQAHAKLSRLSPSSRQFRSAENEYNFHASRVVLQKSLQTEKTAVSGTAATVYDDLQNIRQAYLHEDGNTILALRAKYRKTVAGPLFASRAVAFGSEASFLEIKQREYIKQKIQPEIEKQNRMQERIDRLRRDIAAGYAKIRVVVDRKDSMGNIVRQVTFVTRQYEKHEIGHMRRELSAMLILQARQVETVTVEHSEHASTLQRLDTLRQLYRGIENLRMRRRHRQLDEVAEQQKAAARARFAPVGQPGEEDSLLGFGTPNIPELPMKSDNEKTTLLVNRKRLRRIPLPL